MPQRIMFAKGLNTEPHRIRKISMIKYAKYIGAVVGFIILRIPGAIIGFLIGAYITWKWTGGFLGSLLGGNVDQRKQRQAVFIKTVFTLMGKLAKADGRISAQEIAHAEKFMRQLGMVDARRNEAIAMFKEGAESGFLVEPVIEEFNTVCAASPALKQVVLVYLVSAALSDGSMHPAERELLNQIAEGLGYSQAAFEQLLAMLRGQDQFSGGAYQSYRPGAGPSAADALAAAYQALGVSDSDSDAVVKKAYRKLIREFHPDKLIGQGLPEDMVKQATERSQEIQVAYALIKKSRHP